jgi:hypothetical protein
MRVLCFAVAVWMSLCALAAPALAESFTYQGRLTAGGTNANGNFDLRFRLFDDATGDFEVAADRVQALRRAFDATMKDKDFLADATKAKLEIDPLTGEQMQDVIAKVLRTQEPVAARVRKALEVKKSK